MRRNTCCLSFLALLITACPDGDVTVTTNVTTYSTMSSPSTNVTSDEPTEPTTTGLDGSDTGVPAFPSTGGPDWTSTGEDPETGTTEDTTGGPAGPIPDPPSGCAHFVEIGGRQTPEKRWVIVDASECERASDFTIRFGGTPGSEVDTGIPFNPCAILGGPESPAADPVVGLPRVVVVIGDAVEPPVWTATLLVDGEVSDNVRVPVALQGQHWPEEPEAPFGPIRRRDDWSWVPTGATAPTCGLLIAG